MKNRLAVFEFATAALVDRKLCIDQFAVVPQKPFNAVVLAAFFIRRERDDDVALGDKSFLLQMNQRGDPDRRH